MTNGPLDRLSATHQSVLVLRLVVEIDGRVMGELVNPLSGRRQRYTGLAGIVDAVREWIVDALSITVDESKQLPDG